MDRFVHALIQWQAADRPAPARTLTVEQVRRRYADNATRGRDGAALAVVAGTADHQVDGGDGEFGVRTYLPTADRGRLVTYLHGGGWTVGDVDTHDPVCRRIAAALGAVVVSVDYRRAPEHPHPGPLRDGIAAAAWADRSFPGRGHVIAGDSAGGALALGIAMHRRDHGGAGFRAQLLVYPPADPSLQSESVRRYGSGYLSELDDLLWYYDQYLPDPGSRTDPAIDLLNADLRGLPPTVIGTAEFDPLHDEGVELAARMAASGVDVQHIPAPGLVHGYLLMAGIVPAASAVTRDVLAAVEQKLASVPMAHQPGPPPVALTTRTSLSRNPGDPTVTITGPYSTVGVRTLADALRLRGEQQPDDTAYVFLRNGEEPHESLTYGRLHSEAGLRAGAFAAAGLAGRSAVLLYPSGLEFVRTLLGCMYGRVAGAPVQVPRRREEVERLRRIADDAGTSTVLTTTDVARDLRERFGGMPELCGLTLLATDGLPYDPDAAAPAPAGPADTALLQYTSGSTGDPKGVVVSHANFLANVVETDELWPCEPDGTVVNWLPLFHDMGMLFGVVMPLWAGIPSYLMAPEAFIRRPARWLEAIARFGGTHAAAPSFAYELCVRAAADGRTGAVGDLSRWRVAANGAEPVRWATVRSFADAFAPHGFDPRAMCPGYGLAENTLKATGSRQDREPTVLWLSAEALRNGTAQPVGERAADAVALVGSGGTVGRTRVRIVDPLTRRGLPDGQVGEIWINGPCVTGGYHGRAKASEETFRARVAGPRAGGEPHLRTGDLGFLHGGELYVTGRLKDVIIRKGRNHYPQDIELSAELAVPGAHPNCAAAFSSDDGERERLVVVVEADGRLLNLLGAEGIRRRVLDAVRERNRITPDEVLVVRRGAVPKTSSGKVQRRACRRRYENAELAVVGVPAATAAAGEA